MTRPKGTKGPEKKVLKTTILKPLMLQFENHCKSNDLFWNEVLEKLIIEYLTRTKI